MLMGWAAIVFYGFVAVTCIQLFYYLYFFRRVAFYKPAVQQELQQHPVSVIVCARDEDKNLARNLPGVLVQNYPNTHEVVVVNDNSVDDSKYILEELQKSFQKLQIVNLTQEAKLIAGKKYPLSIGIKEAKHEIMVLTDADCVPASENWLTKMQESFVNGIDVVLGYGAFQKRQGFCFAIQGIRKATWGCADQSPRCFVLLLSRFACPLLENTLPFSPFLRL